jgi:transposase
MGVCREVHLRYSLHRIYCRKCHERSMEHIPFQTHAKARLTLAFERTILELREHMSIRAVSNYFRLRWHTVKELEKKHLKKKFSKIPVSHVKIIGIDEIYVSRTAAQKFITVIRDLESGAVLYVGDGKGTAALDGALKMLKKSKLKAVAMDMSNAYSSWFQTHFPEVKIVFDHFHVIKSMNEKLDAVRRRVIAKLDDTQRSQFRGLRFIFLQNN